MLISGLESSLFCFQLVQTIASKFIFLTPAAWTTSMDLASQFSSSQTHPQLSLSFPFLSMENFHSLLPLHHFSFTFITGTTSQFLFTRPSFFIHIPLTLKGLLKKQKQKKKLVIKFKGEGKHSSHYKSKHR